MLACPAPRPVVVCRGGMRPVWREPMRALAWLPPGAAEGRRQLAPRALAQHPHAALRRVATPAQVETRMDGRRRLVHDRPPTRSPPADDRLGLRASLRRGHALRPPCCCLGSTLYAAVPPVFAQWARRPLDFMDLDRTAARRAHTFPCFHVARWRVGIPKSCGRIFLFRLSGFV